jgi:putative ATP-dependent endonuclease of the OLD family
MRLLKIEINNFRKLLSKVIIDIEDETLIVGKNNTGKTSVSELFIKFFSPIKAFKLEDFSSSSISKDLINDIYLKYTQPSGDPLNSEEITFLESMFPIISMDIFIKIEASDNLALIKPLLYEFDNNEEIIIKLKYEFKGLKKCVEDFKLYNKKLISKYETGIEEITFYDFFKRNFMNYYKINGYSSKPHQLYDHQVEIKEISDLFNIGIIAAQREVDDTSDQNLQSISNALWSYYQNITKENTNINQEDVFRTSISNIKENLNNDYNELFKELLISINDNIMNYNPFVTAKLN